MAQNRIMPCSASGSTTPNGESSASTSIGHPAVGQHAPPADSPLLCGVVEDWARPPQHIGLSVGQAGAEGGINLSGLLVLRFYFGVFFCL